MSGDARGTRVGAYVLLDTLGRGGMGVVYRAVHLETKRDVALKVLAPSAFADPDAAARAVREARAAATVRHEAIVALLDAGTHAGQPFLVFELVPGGSLADRLKREGRVPWREAARLGAAIARGLAALHARGIVHRDVKPANVLLDAQGAPKLADLGLAWGFDLARSASLTAAGEIVGTVAFLSPEQVEGRHATGASDLYALGATLFTLVAGEPPFKGSQVAVLQKHLHEAPPSLRALAPEVPEAFDRLVRQLLAKKPEERPLDGATVANALDAFAKGEKRSAARGVPALVLALGAAIVAVLAHALLHRAPPLPPATPHPAPAAPVATPSSSPRPHRGVTYRHTFGSRAFNALDGVFSIATIGSDRFVTGDTGGRVMLWDATSGEPLAIVGQHRAAVNALVPLDHGTVVAVSGPSQKATEGEVRIWDLARRESRVLLENAPAVHSAAVSSDGRLLACGTFDGHVNVWSGLPWTKKHSEFAAHARNVQDLAFGEGSRLFTVGEEGVLSVWDAATGTAIVSTICGGSGRHTLAVAPDGKHVLVGGDKILTRCWNEALTDVATISTNAGGSNEVLWAGSDEVVSVERGVGVTRTRLSTRAPLGRWTGFDRDVLCSALLPDGSLVVGGKARRLHHLAARVPGEVTDLEAPAPFHRVFQLAADVDDGVLVADADGLWSIAKGDVRLLGSRFGGDVVAVAPWAKSEPYACGANKSIVWIGGPQVDVGDPLHAMAWSSRGLCAIDQAVVFHFPVAGEAPQRDVLPGPCGPLTQVAFLGPDRAFGVHAKGPLVDIQLTPFRARATPDDAVSVAATEGGEALVVGHASGAIELRAIGDEPRFIRSSGARPELLAVSTDFIAVAALDSAEVEVFEVSEKLPSLGKIELAESDFCAALLFRGRDRLFVGTVRGEVREYEIHH